MEPFYRSILKRSWQITKKYKFLWPLGFFAAFLGSTADLAFFLDYTDKIKNQPLIWQNFNDYLQTTGWGDFFYQFNSAPILTKLFILFLLIFSVAFILFLLLIAVSAKAGLINGINEIEERETGSFKTSFQVGSKFLWPVLQLILLAKIIIFVIITFFLTPLIIILIVKNSQVVFWIFLIAFLLFLPILLIINFVTNYAIAYLVLYGKKVWQAIKSGWQLFINNWLISLEMAIILLLINLLIGILLIIFILLISSPLVIMIIFSTNVFWFYLLLSLVILLTFITTLVITVLLNVYQTSAWILLFFKLNKTKLYSKLERLTMINVNPVNK